MANGKQLDAELKISGELDESLKRAIKTAEKNMGKLSEAAKKSEGSMGALNEMVKKQSRTLKAAQSQYASYVLNGEQASTEARELANGIAALNADLEKNKSALRAAQSAAEGLASEYGDLDSNATRANQGLKDNGDNANRANSNFDTLKGAAATLASAGFAVMVSKATDAARTVWDLAEQTRDFRQDLSSLETAYGQANFGAETATKTFESLYAIFGEDDRAVETANNIARMAKNQQDLNNWVTITQGAWGIYQDALPVENLAEAAGETAKTGKVVGGLADALNWSSKAAEMFAQYMGGDVATAEDAFNVALSECSTEQERQALITSTLLELYGDAAGEYEKNAGSLMEANKQAVRAQEAQAKLGEIIEPVTTAWQGMKIELMEAVAPALEIVAEKAQQVMEWLQEHPAVMTAIVTALGLLAGAITIVTGVVAVYTAVQLLANAALLPVVGIILGIVTVIGLAIAAGVWLADNWDKIRVKAQEVWQVVVSTWQSLIASLQVIWDTITTNLSNVWTNIKNKASSFAKGVVNNIKSSWDKLTGILTAPFKSVIGFIDTVGNKLSGLLSKAKSTGSGIIDSLPHFATGGFTNGLSIAGEAGTEAVISFDPRYRMENLRYWKQAGRLLGANSDGYKLSGVGHTSRSTTIDGVTFAPNITVTGNAEKQDIIDAIRATYPEFIDLIEEVLADIEVGAYV